MTLIMVGDGDQMLYRFAGAKPEVLAKEIVDIFPEIETFKLNTNYRSTEKIVERSLQLIENNYENAGGPYPEILKKSLVARPGAPSGAEFSFSEYFNAEEEAKNVAGDISMAIEREEREPGDFFVLSRTKAQLAWLEGELAAKGLPYINLTGSSFFSQKHIRQLVSYLKLAVDHSDKDAFTDIYNVASIDMKYPFGEREGQYCHHRWLGKKFLQACRYDYRNVYDQTGNWRWKEGAFDLLDMMNEIEIRVETRDVADTLRYIASHYVEHLKADEGMITSDEAENGKLEDIGTLIEIAERFQSYGEFIEYYNLLVNAQKDKDDSKSVVISTIHRVKGKERPVVYLIGASEGYNTENDLPAGLLPHTFSMTPPPQMGVLPTGGKGRIEDERCLFFVAITRAKDEVHISSISEYRGTTNFHPSRFVREIGL